MHEVPFLFLCLVQTLQHSSTATVSSSDSWRLHGVFSLFKLLLRMNSIPCRLCLLLSWLYCILAMEQSQATFNQNEDQLWKLTLSRDWDVLGPFPIHAREQQFLSPSFPIDCELRSLACPFARPTVPSVRANQLAREVAFLIC